MPRMRSKSSWLGSAAAAALALSTIVGGAHAADHFDSPAAQSDPGADITDTYAWMSSDASKLNLIINVSPDAGADAVFPTSTQYAFHIESRAAFDATTGMDIDVICQFYDVNRIECWAGDEYVEGDPSATAGIANASDSLRVFAGRRDDPFFFELAGFGETVEAVIGAAGGLVFTDGCPALDDPTRTALVDQLMSGEDGAPASDTLDGQNVLSLVIQIDKDVVNAGGDTLAIWASTHTAPAS